jgi:hypothetical protein
MARIISFALALLVACQSPARFAEARTLKKKPMVHEQTQPKEEQKPNTKSQ